MRKVNLKIEDIIEQITQMKGKNVDLEVTRGRKKTVKLSGIIESVYPSIFTIRNNQDKTSFSYSEVLCGNVTFTEPNQAEEA